MTGAAGWVVAAVGAIVVVVALADLFVTVFNYDGFTFLAGRVQRGTWALLRTTGRALPQRARAAYLSLGSAAMLPVTMAWWLALEILGFALTYLFGLANHDFTMHGTSPGFGTALYLSGGCISSLTFGDVTPATGVYRALCDLETVVGLATFTIGLTYVITAFDAVGSLNRLHARVRRQAISPNRPATILTRHFSNGQAAELTSLLQSLVEDLAEYDDALRRYPVVFYFHTRRQERSIPRIYTALGEVIELLRWGLSGHDDVTHNPYLLALADQFDTTGNRLLRSFVDAPPPADGDVPDRDAFAAAWRGENDGDVAEFARVRETAREATGLRSRSRDDMTALHEQYCEWLVFHRRRTLVTTQVSKALCYDDVG